MSNNFDTEFEINDAVRSDLFVKVGIAGPSGSGKTLSALLMAVGMVLGNKDLHTVTESEWRAAWQKVCLADTENKSGLYYVGAKQVVKTKKGPLVITIYPYKHIPFAPPYEPQRYERLIWKMANTAGIEVGIVDSISHEWNGEGGALQMVEKFGQSQKGGNFSGWNKVTPLHDAFIEAIKQSPLHLICTLRSKQEHVREEVNGKTTIRKVGMNSVQREGMDYEFGVLFDVNMDHTVSTGKDRTKLFEDLAPFAITPAVGKRLIEWAKTEQAAEVLREPPKAASVEQPVQTQGYSHPVDAFEPPAEFNQAQQQLAKTVSTPAPQQAAPVTQPTRTWPPEREQQAAPAPVQNPPQTDAPTPPKVMNGEAKKKSALQPAVRTNLIKLMQTMSSHPHLVQCGIDLTAMIEKVSKSNISNEAAETLITQLQAGNVSFFVPENMPAAVNNQAEEDVPF